MDHSEIRLLRAFLVLMAERGVSRAGDRLGLSQPAMSHLLGRLRALFEDPLLLRSGNTMVPTARAVEIEKVVIRIIGEYDQLIAPAKTFDCTSSARTFSISAPEFAERLLIPPLLRGLRKVAPNVRIVVRPPDPGRSFAMLESGDLDMRIAWLTSPFKSLRSMPLFQDRLVCIVDRDRLDIGDHLTVEQFLTLPHALGYGHTTTTRVLDEAVARHRRKLTNTFLVQNFQTVPYLLPGTDLIATLPRLLAMDYAIQHPIRILDLPLRLPPVRYSAYWHERSHRDAAHRWLRSMFVAVARDLSRPSVAERSVTLRE